MLQNTKALKITYGLKSMADYKARILESTVQGLHLQINNRDAYFRLIGEFNAYNLTLVYGAAVELGMESDDVLAILSGLRGADGRFEQVIDPDSERCGIVDYAHTPDALENVLETISKVKGAQSTVITVVGCGGDRDTTKRPLMAQVAAKMSDKVILTSDNPRSEDPEKILDDMEAGLDNDSRKKVIRISDRLQAIKTAVMMSDEKDIILVAGKGHENYQEIKGEKFPFNDKDVLKDFLRNG
jgi:UDP-N-acetylmuramoyl-L-alanyl-D-glutamate--2,6-diaminopimelate ligase